MGSYDGNALGFIVNSTFTDQIIDYAFLASKVDFVGLLAGTHETAIENVGWHIDQAAKNKIPLLIMWLTQPDWPAVETVTNLETAKLMTPEKNREVAYIKQLLVTVPKTFAAFVCRCTATVGMDGKPMDKQWVSIMTQKFVDQVKSVIPTKPVLLYSNDDYIKKFASDVHFSMFDWTPPYLGFPNTCHDPQGNQVVIDCGVTDWDDVRNLYPDGSSVKPDGLNTNQAFKFCRWGIGTLPLGKQSASVGLMMFNGKVEDMKKFLKITTPGTPTDPTDPTTPVDPTVPGQDGDFNDSQKLNEIFQFVLRAEGK